MHAEDTVTDFSKNGHAASISTAYGRVIDVQIVSETDISGNGSGSSGSISNGYGNIYGGNFNITGTTRHIFLVFIKMNNGNEFSIKLPDSIPVRKDSLIRLVAKRIGDSVVQSSITNVDTGKFEIINYSYNFSKLKETVPYKSIFKYSIIPIVIIITWAIKDDDLFEFVSRVIANMSEFLMHMSVMYAFFVIVLIVLYYMYRFFVPSKSVQEATKLREEFLRELRNV